MHKNKKSGIIGIIITIVILIIIVIFSNMSDASFNQIGNTLSSLIMPVQNGVFYIKNKIQGNSTFFTNIKNLKEENEELKKKNSDLEQSLRELEIIKSENDTLKQYVNLKEKYSTYTTVPAYVINKDTSNYTNVIVINAGASEGITVNMAVISDMGLVGHVISVNEKTSKVQTLLDTSSAVSSVVGSGRDNLIVRGTLDDKKLLKATSIPTSVAMAEGDKVETSGMGGIYPRGVTIGTIKKVTNTKNFTNRYAMIEPVVNFDKLETVLVITKQWKGRFDILKKTSAIIIIILMFFIIYFLQSNFFTWFNIGGIMPNLYVILILFIGLFIKKKLGIAFGIIFGLFLDIVARKSIGISSISFALIGLLTEILGRDFSKDSRLTIILMVTASTAIFETIAYIFGILLNGAAVEILSFIRILSIEILFNAFITIIIYPLMKKIGYYFEDSFTEKAIMTRFF